MACCQHGPMYISVRHTAQRWTILCKALLWWRMYWLHMGSGTADWVVVLLYVQIFCPADRPVQSEVPLFGMVGPVARLASFGQSVISRPTSHAVSAVRQS